MSIIDFGLTRFSISIKGSMAPPQEGGGELPQIRHPGSAIVGGPRSSSSQPCKGHVPASVSLVLEEGCLGAV